MNENKIKQLNIEIEKRNTYLKKGLFASLFSTPIFLIEISLILVLSLAAFLNSPIYNENLTHLFFTFLFIVFLGGISSSIDIKKLYIEEIRLISEFLEKEDIPDTIELGNNRRITL